MDPNANLAEQRRLSALIIAQEDNGRGIARADILRLSELVIALDEWVAGGGFLPDAWTRCEGVE